MPLVFGTGELATRLRQALDLRGRIPLMCDEMVVPVARVIDATEAPFRSDGVSWSVSSRTAGFAGNWSAIGIVAELPASAVVQQVIVANMNATAQIISLYLNNAVYLAADACSTERSVLAAFTNIPIDVSIVDLGAAALPAGSFVLATMFIPAGTSLVIPMELLLSGQLAPGVNPGLFVAVEGAGSGIAASFRGKYFTPLVNAAG